MKKCEQCPNGNSACLRESIEKTLFSYGINPDFFIRSSPVDRIKLIEKYFELTDLPKIRIDKEKSVIDIGVLVVKPEMYENYFLVENYLKKILNIKIISSKEIIYTPEQYYRTYSESFKNDFKSFPHGSLLMLSAIVLPSRLIVFKHNTIDFYKKKHKEIIGKEITDKLPEFDPQFVFNHLFIKNNDVSIRKEICLPILKKNGFDDFKNSPDIKKCWDFSETFINRSSTQNERTFNGLHCPNDYNELQKAIYIFDIKK